MLRLGGKCWPSVQQFCKMAGPVCRQTTHAAITWRSFRIRAPPISTLSALQRSAPLRCCGLHTSSSLHKRRQNAQEEEFDQTMQNYKDELRKTPRPAVYLSVAGLIPVVVAPLTMSFGGYYYPEMAFLQLAAANCLLSFYGGIRWGISVPENSTFRPDSLNFGLGAFLPFVAWTSLVVSDDISISAVTVMAGLIVGALGGFGMLPPFPFWLSFLRNVCFLLTFCCILTTMWYFFAYPEKSLKNQSPK
ncbi:transmembrane protein 69 [Phyllobates terribilis]|uniref:transmembrane protein 69 n=1 Tax=Phyllobates terribilis TaxID=111132 RepID=UPI003CCB5C0D